jgi:hypothetical protein
MKQINAAIIGASDRQSHLCKFIADTSSIVTFVAFADLNVGKGSVRGKSALNSVLKLRTV